MNNCINIEKKHAHQSIAPHKRPEFVLVERNHVVDVHDVAQWIDAQVWKWTPDLEHFGEQKVRVALLTEQAVDLVVDCRF